MHATTAAFNAAVVTTGDTFTSLARQKKRSSTHSIVALRLTLSLGDYGIITKHHGGSIHALTQHATTQTCPAKKLAHYFSATVY